MAWPQIRRPHPRPTITSPVRAPASGPLFELRRLAPGVALATLIAVLALGGSHLPVVKAFGMSTLTLAIVLGMLIGNIGFRTSGPTDAGVDFCKSSLLRLGIVLFGFRITFQQIGEVGMAGIAIGIAVVMLTFAVALCLGTRVFGLDRQTSVLIGAGASICGAAAVMATQGVVRAKPETVSVAIATVVVFGTLSMFIYPLLYPYLGFDEHAYGVFVGSTVHEVAQVVAAGQSIGEQAAATAVIEKMWRVMLLAPFLLALGIGFGTTAGQSGRRASTAIPWFAVLFIAAATVNSLEVLPLKLVEVMVSVGTFLLAVAMAALGFRTRLQAIREAGVKPLKLGATICVFLIFGGYFINVTLARLLA